MLAGLPGDQIAALGEYGFNLGIAFQLVDDLLDLTGSAESLGKPVASDLREGKITLPLIYLLQEGDHAAGDLIRDVVRQRSLSAEQWTDISRLLATHGSLDRAYDTAVRHRRDSQAEARRRSRPSQERDALMALPDYVLSRDR